jgi:hypothetical protein
MSPPATTPALTLLPIAPLDGESGYLRWKESVLLRLHTLGLAHVLSEEEEDDRPADEKQRARDDALCRGHILATLSDRLLPVYAHHATAGAVWRQGFGFRFWIFTGPERNGRNSGISVLFGHLNLNFRTKFAQILNFQKKFCKIPQIQ